MTGIASSFASTYGGTVAATSDHSLWGPFEHGFVRTSLGNDSRVLRLGAPSAMSLTK